MHSAGDSSPPAAADKAGCGLFGQGRELPGGRGHMGLGGGVHAAAGATMPEASSKAADGLRAYGGLRPADGQAINDDRVLP